MNYSFTALALVLFAFSIISAFAQDETKIHDEVVVLETPLGDMVIELFPEAAPNHVENFVQLTEDDFYDNTLFHRIISDFMIQGGDPNTKPDGTTQSEWGTGNPGYTVDAEFNSIEHVRGIVSMARSSDPNSAGSQFFIVHKDSNFLDGQYTVFGRLATQESFETLDKIASLETNQKDIPLDTEKARILDARVIERSKISKLLEQSKPITSEESTPTKEQKYENKKLGIAFKAPTGWLIQEPDKTRPEIPDVVAVGPKTDEINPVISVTIEFLGGKNLEGKVTEIRKNLQPSIDTGQLEIRSEEKTTIKQLDAYITNAVGIYNTTNITVPVKFKEVIIEGPDKFYTITYSNDEKEFDKYLPQFEKTIESFEIKGLEQSVKSEEIETSASTNGEGGGCLIATAAFGSEMSEQVQILREMRDNIVLNTDTGKSFMAGFNQIYYSFSPTVSDWERQNPVFKEVVKISLLPMLFSLSILNHADPDSNQSVFGYGLTIILMNVGMYVVAPTVTILKLKSALTKCSK